MRTTINILLSGHDETDMEILHRSVQPLPQVKVRVRATDGNVSELFSDPTFRPDILVHLLGPAPERELECLSRLNAPSRPAMLVIYNGGAASSQLMRLAMQAGARDFVLGPQFLDDALAAIRKILKEELARQQGGEQAVTAVVNAKGGAGASTIASGIAHALSTSHDSHTLLLDLDFQFGSQCLRLDLSPEQGLMEALAAVDSLDEIALTGYVAQHASGLHLLTCLSSQVVLPGEVSEARLARLLDLAVGSYSHVVVDQPRLIDPIFSLVLERAEHIIVVLQQDLTSLRDAQRLLKIMTNDLGTPETRIKPVINRYSRNNPISAEDMRQALGVDDLFLVANDFANFQKAANLGVPLAEYAPHSAATLSIQKIALALAGNQVAPRQGAVRRFLSRFLSGD
ncbi:AAA family ATPase [Methyloterricola oryzae]|uniref:AAA family ATPase n=1 Tax=Methyloterricola oryzae TaxID=1495050 RepID=UPI0005EBA24C|nr:AAA family ATPase [Methyloterricola oryzae]